MGACGLSLAGNEAPGSTGERLHDQNERRTDQLVDDDAERVCWHKGCHQWKNGGGLDDGVGGQETPYRTRQTVAATVWECRTSEHSAVPEQGSEPDPALGETEPGR
jgi:hypothetical protein